MSYFETILFCISSFLREMFGYAKEAFTDYRNPQRRIDKVRKMKPINMYFGCFPYTK